MQDTQTEPNESNEQLPIEVVVTAPEDTYEPRPSAYESRDTLAYQKRRASPVRSIFKSTAHYLFFMLTTKPNDTHKEISNIATKHIDNYISNSSSQGSSTLAIDTVANKKNTHRGELVFLCVSVIFLIISFATFLTLQRPYDTKIAKNNYIAGIDISNDDFPTASQKITSIANLQPISISIDGTTHTFSAQELGVKRDIPGLIESNYKEKPKLIEKLTIHQNLTEQPITYINKSKFISTIESKLGQYKVAENAKVKVEGDKVVVTPSKNGIALNFDKIIGQVQNSAITETLKINAELTKTTPIINTETAEKAKAEADAFLSKTYAIDSKTNGIKQVSLKQKASWIIFNIEGISIKTDINAEAAKNTLTQLAKSFNKTGKDKITLTLNGQPSTVIDSGQDGVVVDQESINNMLLKVNESIAARQDTTYEINLATQAATERNLGNIDGGKFVLVDVAHLKAYAIENNTTARTMLVSTGTSKMPTPAGHFKVMSKLKNKTMTGCNKAAGCWTVPNVPNVQFFTPQGHALHGTYWHNAFGKENRSHGCVNLSLTDAAWLYNWTQVGTDVIVIR